MQIKNPVVAATYSSILSAEMAQSELGARGIESQVLADDAGGMYPSLQVTEGVRLVVDSDRLSEARRILEFDRSGNTPAQTPAPVSKPVPAGAKAYFGYGLIAGLVLGATGHWAYQTSYYYGRYTESIDSDDDGHPDHFIVYEGGKAVISHRDRNFDGKADQWDFYENGLLTRAEEDQNFDGTVDVRWAVTNGNWSSAIMDTDFNGVMDLVVHYSNGIIARTSWRPNQSAHPVREFGYVHGVMKEEWRDVDGDGRFDVQVIYDPFSHPIRTNVLPEKLLSAP